MYEHPPRRLISPSSWQLDRRPTTSTESPRVIVWRFSIRAKSGPSVDKHVSGFVADHEAELYEILHGLVLIRDMAKLVFGKAEQTEESRLG
jgi:hypothetical protein